jgi:hypothetical protein
LVDWMANILTHSHVARYGNPPVQLRPLENLISDVPVYVRYVKIHTHNGRFLCQRTYVSGKQGGKAWSRIMRMHNS